MTRDVDRFSWRGRDLTELLRDLDREGWAVLRDLDRADAAAIRRIVKAIEREAGWHLRTEYLPGPRSLSFVRSTPID